MKYIVECLAEKSHLTVHTDFTIEKGKYAKLPPLIFTKKGEKAEISQEAYRGYARGVSALASEGKVKVSSSPEPLKAEGSKAAKKPGRPKAEAKPKSEPQAKPEPKAEAEKA